MHTTDVVAVLGATDIYLIDQIMKGRYTVGDTILDAGCGRGRNLHWFLRNGFVIYGVDANPAAIQELQQANSALPPGRFAVGNVENLSFSAAFFDAIICSAVLHFARSTDHFFAMLDSLFRVLKPGGSLFIRMASDIGIEERAEPLGGGVFYLPDGSSRFLLTRQLLADMEHRYRFLWLEDFKTVNVADLRSMSTLVLQKLS